MRKKPEEAAKALVAERYPHCRTALLGGSVVRGEATARSDLDIVVIDDHLSASFRESLVVYGWPVEAFIHNSTSYRDFFERDCKEGTPSMPKMCHEGVLIKDDGFAAQLKREAASLLQNGPEPWTREDINIKRYFLTDALDDFEGSSDRAEDLFIANSLAFGLHEFILRTNGCWTGSSKWVVRALKQYDETICARFVAGFDQFYKTGEKEDIITFTDEVLTPYGGRLFDGFSIGKPI